MLKIFGSGSKLGYDNGTLQLIIISKLIKNTRRQTYSFNRERHWADLSFLAYECLFLLQMAIATTPKRIKITAPIMYNV